MFERFTERARRVVVHAQEEARLLDHDSIGTGHILLGLMREGEGVAAQVLESFGLDLAAVRQQVAEIVGQGKQGQDTQGHIPFTARAKKVLELSLREAQQLGDNHIGTEHILLGLLRLGDGTAARVLVSLGTDLNRVRAQVIQLEAVIPPAEEAAAGRERERELVAIKVARLYGSMAAGPSDLPSLAELVEQVRQLSEEVERLRGLLRQHGLEPGEGTA